MTRMFVLLTAAAVSMHAAGDSTPELAVRVLNDAGVPDDMLEEAMSTATKVYRKAGVHLVWLGCGTRKSRLPGACVEGKSVGARVLILVPGRSVGQWAPAPGELGRALLREDRTQGRVAYIFPSLVEALAARAARGLTDRLLYSRLLYHRVLGYAMAHELAHLLGVGHGTTGVMSAAWDQAVVKEILRGSLTLEPKEAARVLACVAGEGCNLADEGNAMTIGGHKTRTVGNRDGIQPEAKRREAAAKIESSTRTKYGQSDDSAVSGGASSGSGSPG